MSELWIGVDMQLLFCPPLFLVFVFRVIGFGVYYTTLTRNPPKPDSNYYKAVGRGGLSKMLVQALGVLRLEVSVNSDEVSVRVYGLTCVDVVILVIILVGIYCDYRFSDCDLGVSENGDPNIVP